MFGGVCAPFAVVFSDGGRKINVGSVVVDHSLKFKTLLSLLSHRIGISPHHCSVYLAALGTDRRIPVTSKFNLAAVPRDGIPYFFLVKRRRFKKTPPAKRAAPENQMLRRRGDTTPVAAVRPAVAPPVFHLAEYKERMRNLKAERERFLMNMAADDVVTGEIEAVNGGSGDERNDCVECEECSKMKLMGIDDGFHLCVLDKVVVGFRSPAGPIAPPARKSGVVAAD